MKKNDYIQPAVEVTAIQATYNVLSESNPFGYEGESPIDAEPV